MPGPDPRSSRRPPGTLQIGSIAGSPVLVSSSWFVIAALIAMVMAPRAEQVAPGLGVLAYVAGFGFAVLLYGSVLVHEAAHALMARRYGFRVSSITLHFLGGVTAIEGEARTARQEFLIAVVGPLTSLGVGGVALGLWSLGPQGLLLLAVEGLASANLLVGILNLVPGLPLDGGRVLKAAVWRATGSALRGTVAAGWGGRVAALLVLGWPLLQEQVLGSRPSLIDYVLTFIVAGFLWTGASASLANARLRARLPRLVARDLARRVVQVPADVPLAEAVRRAREAHAGGIVTLTPEGRPAGVVSEAAVIATPDERREHVSVAAVSRSLTTGTTLPVDLAGDDLFRALNQEPAAEYLLLETDGSVYGLLSTQDVDAALARTPH